MKLVFKERIELNVIRDGIEKLTFGVGECVLVSSCTGMINGIHDMIYRDFRDYHLTNGTMLLHVPSSAVRWEHYNVSLTPEEQMVDPDFHGNGRLE